MLMSDRPALSRMTLIASLVVAEAMLIQFSVIPWCVLSCPASGGRATVPRSSSTATCRCGGDDHDRHRYGRCPRATRSGPDPRHHVRRPQSAGGRQRSNAIDTAYGHATIPSVPSPIAIRTPHRMATPTTC